MTKSRLRAKLQAGEFVRVFGINRVTDPCLTEVAGQLGFDVVWFDMEHRPHGYEVIDKLSLAFRSTGVDLVVRIRKAGYTSAMRALEFEEAWQWVEWTRFPPQGKRGFDGASAIG